MKRVHAFILSGAGIGFFVGSSMGIAVGGTAFNAIWLFIPLGAFVGWLLSSRNSAIGRSGPVGHFSDDDNQEAHDTPKPDPGAVEIIFHSALAILAAVWNFHIDILHTVGLLGTFVRQPFLFVGLCIVVSVFFPPFLVIYFLAWIGANHFGIEKENNYRATVQ